MLVELVIHDLALLERASLACGAGLNVVTGETGAGKSLLIDALELLLGERARSGLVRAGASEARIEGRFLLVGGGYGAEVAAWLERELPGVQEEERGRASEIELVLSRTLLRDGRSRAHVNHRPVTSRLLRELAALLVEIHGQNDHQRLLDRVEQRRLLDTFGALHDALAGYRERRERWAELASRLAVPNEPDEGYGTLYFPGTHDPAGATGLQRAAGAELRGVDFRLAKRRVIRIRGKVQGLFRQRPAMIMLQPKRADYMMMMERNVNTSRPNGDFEIRGVTPGSYVLTAQVMDETERGWARLPLEVGESNIDNVVLPIQPGFQVTGRLRVEGDASVRLTSIRIMLRPPEIAGGMVMMGPTPAGAVKEDGTFTLSNVTADVYTITAGGAGENGFVKSARWGDQEVLDAGLDLSGGSAGGMLDIVISTKAGAIDGAVMNEKQEPARGVSVTVAPDARRQNQSQLYRMTQTDQNGMFVFKALAPGDYRLFAWEEVDPYAWRDPEHLKQFETKAKTVTVREGGRERAEMKAIPSETEKQ